MPHKRDRQVVQKLLKRLKFAPIVGLQGARQTGKSFIARDLLKQILPETRYFTLDQMSVAQACRESPETFLAQRNEHEVMMIDEAQKAPPLFDALKLVVDQNRSPGQFLILGSTEFSHLENIRESLTGRLARVRIFPLIYRELISQAKGPLQISRADFVKYLDRGGMPGMTFVRDVQARTELFEDWVNLTCQRDIHQVKKYKLDSDLAFNVLKATAVLAEPTLAEIARFSRESAKKVQSHINALSELFCVIRLNPHSSSKGKSIFLPLDSGVASHLGASLIRKLQVALMNERLTHHQNFDSKQTLHSFYRSSGKNIIHWVEESQDDGKLTAIQLFDVEKIKKTDLALLKAFGEKNPKASLILLAPVTTEMKIEGIQILPWEKACL